MTIVAEDGTGLATAESYTDIAFADAYFLARNNTTWAALTQSAKEAALRNATDYMELRWSNVFVSVKLTTTQALSWPRVDSGFGTMPAVLKKATAEYALRASQASLAPDVKPDSTGRLPTKVISKLGPLDKETTYASRGDMAVPATYPSYPIPDGMIGQLLVSQGVYR